MQQNKTDLILLEEIEELCSIIINKFISRGVIPFNEKEDIKQSLLEKYLLKREKIATAYSGKAQPRTYYSAVLYKMTCEVIRSELNNWKTIKSEVNEMLKYNKDNSLSPEQATIIHNEKDLLDKVLTTFGKERGKIELFLKIFYRVPVNNDDIKKCYKNHEDNASFEITENKPGIKDKELYSSLANLVNQYENKDVKPDAIRMYINKYINSILSRLNGRYQRANYTKETLGILFEIFSRANNSNKMYKISSIILFFSYIFIG